MQPHTSCADMMTFAVLAIGCIMVWGYLLRSYLSCSRALKKVQTCCVCMSVSSYIYKPAQLREVGPSEGWGQPWDSAVS